MRRLVDETTDELTRSLLSAGIEHQPPPGNKARVIMALGAGGALGLFSSNALAWLSTTTGKVTALGVAVGVAGAVWVAVPAARDARSSNEAAGAKVAARTQASVPSDPASSSPASSSPASSSRADGARVAPNANVAGEGVSDDVEGLARSEGSITAGDASNGPHRDPAAAEGATGAHESSARGPADDGRKGSVARRGARKHGAKKASAKGRVAALDQNELRHGEPTSLDAPSTGGPTVDPVDLDTEVRLVDSMHSAARRNDREALGRFLDRYRAAFPDGQLKKEVAEFAARLDRPDISNSR